MRIAREVSAALAALVLFVLLINVATAQPLSPEALVRQVAANVLGATNRGAALQAGEKREALALAEERILPHVDFAEATRLAANAAWVRATPGQQVQMVSAFRAMLVRTYSDAIDAYRGQAMRVRPVKTKAILRSSEAVVQSEYVQPGAAPVGVEYAMRRSGGEWKIYDITVDGVSLVQTYRPVFDHVTRTEGVDGLVRRLKENGKPRPSLAT